MYMLRKYVLYTLKRGAIERWTWFTAIIAFARLSTLSFQALLCAFATLAQTELASLLVAIHANSILLPQDTAVGLLQHKSIIILLY